MKSLNIQVSGKVQDVYFRKHTKAKADELGITGAVVNNLDGTVSIFAQGSDTELEEFLAWSERGPDAAQITRHDHAWKEARESYPDFRIIR